MLLAFPITETQLYPELFKKTLNVMIKNKSSCKKKKDSFVKSNLNAIKQASDLAFHIPAVMYRCKQVHRDITVGFG